MNTEENEFVNCPYCWEQIEVAVDCTVGEQSYVEDCHVCCRPIHFQIHVDSEGFPVIDVMTDND